jgi:NACalpha-BTF3-like transcription factor
MKSILISDELHSQLKDYCNENQLVLKLVVEKSIKERIGTPKHIYADATDVKTPSTEMVRHSFSETDISYAMNTSNITRDEAISALRELQNKF